MPISLLALVQDVSREVGLDPNVTSFSDNDETNDIVHDINAAYRELRRELPEATTYFYKTSMINTVPGTRIYDLASDAEAARVLLWDVLDTTNSDRKLEFVNRSDLSEDYLESTGYPKAFYFEDGDKLGIYPVPDDIYTIRYGYGDSNTTNLTSTTAVFDVPDSWLDFIKTRSRQRYEMRKGFGNAEMTFQEAESLLHKLRVEAWETSTSYLAPDEGFNYGPY